MQRGDFEFDSGARQAFVERFFPTAKKDNLTNLFSVGTKTWLALPCVTGAQWSCGSASNGLGCFTAWHLMNKPNILGIAIFRDHPLDLFNCAIGGGTINKQNFGMAAHLWCQFNAINNIADLISAWD